MSERESPSTGEACPGGAKIRKIALLYGLGGVLRAQSRSLGMKNLAWNGRLDYNNLFKGSNGKCRSKWAGRDRLNTARRWRLSAPAWPLRTETSRAVRALFGPLPSADRERAMETLAFLMILMWAVVLFKRVPKGQKEQMLLRLEYELYKWGFVEYRY